jgi:ribosome-binding protein aMBF1 (putative translation factor)
MLEPTRKPPIDVVELIFRGPSAKKEEAAKLLEKLGFEKAEESVPWREAFPEYKEGDYPAVCLRAARHREGLTQKELAHDSGIPQAHISQMECGKIAIGVTRAKKLAKSLNADYRMFL